MRLYNEKKFCFIICANHQRYLEECLLYLSLLEVPVGYEAEIITISDASSMAAGYNEGMQSSDARYKIYLHQDTFVVERSFLQKLLNVFWSRKDIGMVGMVGTPRLSQDGVMWHEKRCGDFYRLDETQESDTQYIEKLKRKNCGVEAVDGLLIATRVDIPWREDLFKGWDFYDVSQCLEFKRAGYRIVVPVQNPTWTIHACGTPSYWHFNENRQILLKNYPEIIKEPQKKRILFLNSRTIYLLGLPMGLMDLGHHVDIPDWRITLADYSQEQVEYIEEKLEEGHYDLVVTYDFSRNVSVACQERGVKYLAWVYDSPLLELYTKEAALHNNYICVFDRKQFLRLDEGKLKHIYHYPLAAEVDNFGSINIRKKDEKKYAADISFVGRLYNKSGYENLLEKAPEELYREAETIVRGTGCIWDGKDRLFGRASEELLAYMESREADYTFKTYDIDKRFYFESMYLARRANELERLEILNTLAQRFKVTLYTSLENLDKSSLKGVKICPWVDYLAEMPKVFHLSKINLNITSRSIESGIPQRVLDIMAVGGFLLTNYQPELEEHFRIGEELEVYHDMDELLEKTDYYIKHPEKRVAIAVNGYQKVKKDHSYRQRLGKVMDRIFEEERNEDHTEYAAYQCNPSYL